MLDFLKNQFGWSPLFVRAATVLLGVGILAVLVLAWYHGEWGAQRVGRVELALLIGNVVLAGGAVAGTIARRSPRGSRWPAPAPSRLRQLTSFAVGPR